MDYLTKISLLEEDERQAWKSVQEAEESIGMSSGFRNKALKMQLYKNSAIAKARHKKILDMIVHTHTKRLQNIAASYPNQVEGAG